MKTIIITLSAIVLSLVCNAQDFKVPENYKLEKADDYAKYEKDVLDCIDWIINTPINEEPGTRKKANAFIMAWISGSPDVTIELNADILTFIESAPELVMIFMAGWTKYAVESDNYKDLVNGNLAGLEAVINFYVKNKSQISKNKDVEKYIKMKEKGTLKNFVEKTVSKS